MSGSRLSYFSHIFSKSPGAFIICGLIFDHYHKITGHFIDLEVTEFGKKSIGLITCSYYETFGHLCRPDRTVISITRKCNCRLVKKVAVGVRKVAEVLIRHFYDWVKEIFFTC